MSTTGDPATPYANGQRLAELLGTGTVLTVEGEGHTAYPGGRCVNEEVGAYLLAPGTPLTPTTCPA